MSKKEETVTESRFDSFETIIQLYSKYSKSHNILKMMSFPYIRFSIKMNW